MRLLIQRKPSALRGLGFAVLASIAAMLLRYPINGLMAGEMPLMAGMFALIIAAWYGGLWPGLLATFLCASSSVTLFVKGGPAALGLGNALLLLGFLILGTITSLLFEALRAARVRTGVYRSEVQLAHEQRESSQALVRETELRHRLVLETSFDAIYEWALQTNQMVWNEGINTLFGYTSRVVDDSFTWWAEHIHSEDRERIVASFAAAQQSQRDKWSGEYRMRCADGRHIWILDRSELVFDAGGQMVRVVGAMQDISEQRRTAETLAHFKALFEAQPSPFLVVDATPEFRIAAASDAYLSATHTRREDIVGRPLFEAFPDDADALGISSIRPAFEQVLATGRPVQLPVVAYAVPAPDGTQLRKQWWSTYHFSVLGPRGDMAFIVQRADDVSASMQEGAGVDGAAAERDHDARHLENARALAQANARLHAVNSRLAFFVELSEVTRALTDPQEIVAATVRKLGAYLGVSRCTWREFAEDGDHFEELAGYVDGVASIQGSHRLSTYGLNHILAGKSIYASNDVEADPQAGPYLAAFQRVQIRAMISVPLRRSGHLIAGFSVHQSTPRRWTQDEIDLVEQVAERCRDALERSRAVRAVTASEARSRGLLDAMPTKVSTATADGTVDYLHPSWLAYSGQRFEDVGGANWGRLFHPDDLADYQRSRAASLTCGQPFAHEVRVRRHDGAYRWHLARLSPIRDAQGRVRSWVGAVTDIHDRMLAEDALRDRARHLAFLLELGSEIQVLSDPQTIVVKVTQALRTHLAASRCGYVRVEPDQDHYEVVADSVRGVPSRAGPHRFSPVGADPIRSLRADQPYVVHDTQGTLADPERAAFAQAQVGALIFYPLRSGEHFVAGLTVHQQQPRTWTATEIELVGLAARLCWAGVERASALQRVQASNDQLRFLSRLSEAIQPLDDPAAIAQTVCDAIGRRLGLSRCTYARVEADAEHYEQIAQYLDGVSSRAGRRHFRVFGQAWWRHLQSLQALVIADVNHSPDIQVDTQACRSAEIAAVIFVPLHREQQLIGIFALQQSTPRDWTVAEIEAAELAGNLGFESLKRAEAAAQEMLSHQRLRDADRAKDEFLATLAHELRNPLAPISNGVQLLQLRGEDPKLRTQMLELMSRQLTQMVRLVDDLLDVSRITTGKLILRNEPLRLADVVRHAAESVEPLIRAGGHQLQITLPPAPVMLNGDTTRLAQVLANLLTNSVKYSDKPGTIRLSAVCEGGELRIVVQDQGMGIAAEVLPRVFDMFAQSDRALPRSQGGLGIGLSLVRRLVQMHGGRVEGASEGLGCGSTFTVFLPLPESEHVNVEAPAAYAVGAARASPPSKCRVLVADDNEDSVSTLAALLRAWGHEVAIAHDGEEALKRAAEFRPEVMVLDIGMPLRDGLETAREVRAQAWGRKVLLIALSGWGQVADRERTKAAGFDYHMVKPVDSARLEKLLEPTSERPDGLRHRV